jgi:hypothetical protein
VRTTQAPVPDPYATHAGRDNGHPETSAELFTARYFQRAAHVRSAGRDDPLLGWRLIQDAEADARKIATHARIPGPQAARTPGYQADAAARGHWPADQCGRPPRAGKPQQVPPRFRAGPSGATPPRRPAGNGSP